MFVDKTGVMEKITVVEPDGGKNLNAEKAKKQSTNKTSIPRDPYVMPRNLADNIESSRELPGVKANNPANSSSRHRAGLLHARQAYRIETLEELEQRYKRSLAQTRRIKKSLKYRRNMQKRSQRPAAVHHRPDSQAGSSRTPERRRTGFMDVDSHGSNIRPDRGSEKVNRKKKSFLLEKSRESRRGPVGTIVRRIFPCCFKEAESHCAICSPMDA